MAVLDSCFVIDLMRETKRDVIGPARRKLDELTLRGERENGDRSIFGSLTFQDSQRLGPKMDLSPFPALPVSGPNRQDESFEAKARWFPCR